MFLLGVAINKALPGSTQSFPSIVYKIKHIQAERYDLMPKNREQKCRSKVFSPCIMCVQYCGDAQYPGGVQCRGGYHEYRGGDILSIVGGVQYCGEYHDKCGNILSTMGVGVFSTMGDIMSTKGDYLEYHGEYHDAHGGVQYSGGKIFCYLSTPWY